MRSLSHLLFPSLCPGCSRPLVAGEEELCLACIHALPETGFHLLPGNDAEVRFSGRVPFVRATALAYFTPDGILQHLVHALKYQGRKELGRFLGQLLGRQLAAAGWQPGIDVVLPVPLHRAKEAARGYNQSVYIAQGIGSAMNLPVLPGAVTRTRPTESQTHKSRTERAANLQGAFAASLATVPPGAHVLLCDDVLTTGATLEACALALLAAAPIQVSFATIGIAGSP